MAEPQRTPEANLSPAMQPIAAAMLETPTVETPTYEQVITGSSRMVGGFEIPQTQIDLALSGDTAAQNSIRSRIDMAGIVPSKSQPIAGTVQTDTGFKMDLPSDLTPKEAQAMKGYAENRTRLFSFLEGKIPDERVRNLLIDHFETGEFFNETGRQLREIPRFIANVDDYLEVLARFVAPSVLESGPLDLFKDGDVTFSEAFAKRKGQVATVFAKGRQTLREYGVDATYGIKLNRLIKEKFIEKYGQDVFDQDYAPTLEGLGQIENELVPSELGDQLLTFGFRELPVDEQFASFVVQNVPVSGVLGKMHLAKGGRQIKKVDKYLETNPQFSNLDRVSLLRKIEIEEKRNLFTRSWRKATARIGQSFNNRGAIGNVEANQSARDALKNIDTRLKDANKRRDKALNNQNVPKTQRIQDAKVIDGEIEALNSRRNRINFGGASNPYMFSLMVDEAVVAIGQTAGANLFPMVGLSEGSGEIFGALGFAFIGKPAIKMTVAAPFKVVNFISGGNAGVIGMNMVQMIEDVSLAPKGLFTNRSIAELEQAIGRPLEKGEVASFDLLDKLMKGMTIEQRENVYKSIENYNELRDRIVNRFPEGEQREKAAEVFKLSFAHISGLAPLQALEVSSLKKLSPQGIQEAVEFQLQSENSLDIASTAIEQLQKMIKETSGVDTEDSKFLAGWVKNFQGAADKQRLQIQERKIEYLNLLREYKTNMISDPDVDIDKDIVNRLAELEIALVPGARDSIEQQREIILQTTTDVRNRINERSKIVFDMKGSPDFRRQIGLLQEDIYDVHMSSIYATARNAYTKADEAIGNESIDISGAVTAFTDTQGVIEAKDLRGLFDPNADFLNSRSGRMAYNAFNDMAERSLRNNMQLDDEDLSELMQWVTNPASGDDFLGEVGDVSYIDLALHFGKKEGSQFAPFSAKPFELDEVRRHLDKVASSKTDKKEAKPFSDFADSIESSLRANPRVFKEVQAARDTYRDLIFDPTRPSSGGEKILKSSTGPEFVTKIPGGYKRPYKLGMEPETWHRDLGKAINDAVEGKEFAADRVKIMIEDLARFWGDRDDAGNIVFDLTTERGRAKFENVANLVRVNLYEYWGAAKERGLSAATRQNLIGGDIQSGDYDFSARVNLLDNVLPAIQVNVKQPVDQGGELVDDVVSRPLFDISDMVSTENDIVDILAVSASTRADHRRFVDDLNNQIDNSATMGQTAIDLDSRVVKEFEQLSGTKNPLEFYENYILNNDVELVRGLKANFIEAVTKNGDMTVEAAQEEFKQGMIYMLTNGLLKRAGVAPNEQITFKALDGTKRTVNTLTEAATIVSDLDNPNVTQILEEFMDEDHIAFLQDIGEYMMYASGTAASAFKPKGQMRGISPNELISRAFNIARGMVSPTYVAAEFAVRLMGQNDINALSLAASDKEAAKIMQKILETPGQVEKDEIKTLGTILKSFLAREMAKKGVKAEYFVPQQAIIAAQQEQQRTQNETVQ